MHPVTDLFTRQGMPPLVIGSVSQFFTNLLNQGVTPMALAAAVFFFALAAILYMSAGTENTQRQQQSQLAMYIALTGLALALLSTTVAGIVSTAATQSGASTTPAGTPITLPKPTQVPVPLAPFPPQATPVFPLQPFPSQPTQVPFGGH